jgi:hypothetical protein
MGLAQTVQVRRRTANVSTFRTWAWTSGTELVDELHHAPVVRTVEAARQARAA